MEYFVLGLFLPIVLASNPTQKVFYYGEPTVTSQTGFIKVDPQTNAWEPAADGFATAELPPKSAINGFLVDSTGSSSFLYGEFSVWNNTYVGCILQMNTQTMEPYIFNTGVLGEEIAGMAYFDTEKQIAIIGKFFGFQENPAQQVNSIGACYVDGSLCYPLGQIGHYVGMGSLTSDGDMLYALFSNGLGMQVVYLNTTSSQNYEWTTIYETNASSYFALEIYQESLWMFGALSTPDNQIVGAARWNFDENSWEYMLNSSINIDTASTPVTTVSPDGLSVYMQYSSSTFKWNNETNSWDLFCVMDCAFASSYVAATNDGLMISCSGSVFFVSQPGETTALNNLTCSHLWISISVSADNNTLYALCQNHYFQLESTSYDLRNEDYQTATTEAGFESLQLKSQTMCVYGSKILMSGSFTKISNTTAYGIAAWDNNKQKWFALVEDSVLECHCDTDGNEMAVLCLNSAMESILIVDYADNDFGSGTYADNIEVYYLTTLDAIYISDLKLVNGVVYFSVLGYSNLYLDRWTQETGIETVFTGSWYYFKFVIIEDIVYLAGQFFPGNSTEQLTAARYNMTDNTWLPMDQIYGTEGNATFNGYTYVMVLWNGSAEIYIGGDFSKVGNLKVSNWAGFNEEGTATDSVSGGVPGVVNFLAPCGDRMYILADPKDCLSNYNPSCGYLFYYDATTKTYSYPIASGVGIVAVGYDIVNNEASSSSEESFFSKWGIALVVSIGACLVMSVGIAAFVWHRRNRNLVKSSYQEIPDVREPGHNEPLDFQHEEFVLKSVLGKGAYGTVWSCVFPHRAGGTYAVKQMLFSKGDTKRIEIVKKEIDLLEKFRHPHIVHYCGYRVETTDTSVEFFIFMELYEHPCSLKGVIQKALKQNQKGKKNYFTYAEIKNYLFQVADGLYYLHHQGVAHRDLKCANILIRAKGAVVNSLHIADFGIARAMSAEGGPVLASTMLGTPSFMAPEVLKNQPYDAFKADIWSFGMLLYEMLCWKEPEIPGQKPEFPEEVLEFANQDQRFHNVVEIFDKCTQMDPNSRPTAADLLFLCENLP